MQALLSSPSWPFAILIMAIAAVVIMISVFRFHPFVALILAAIFVGLISPELPILKAENPMHPLARALEYVMRELGNTAGKIAWVIALAAIIGTAMMESGAAGRIVTWLLKTLGQGKAALALLISGFLLSIPVFFDTVFFLLVPLAITLGLKTGKNYVLYIVAIAGGAVITHSMVPPTPGPLIMAEELNIDLGITILAGLAFGILPAIVTLYVGKRMNARFDIPIRVATDYKEEEGIGPGLLLSLLPIIIPIIFISFASIADVMLGELPGWIAFWGNKNIAMLVGTAIALWLWAKQKKLTAEGLWQASNKPLEIAGIIILITSAGGAFGAMIKHSGIGNAIEVATADFQINYIILAWLIAAVMKTAQGSGTVSMITSSSIMAAIIFTDSGTLIDLPYHPIYILLSIGFGSAFISWMNDSGFWVVAKMSGFTEREALSTWTVLLAIIAVVGLIQVLIMSMIFPFK